jgi:terminase small subunit-like protein
MSKHEKMVPRTKQLTPRQGLFAANLLQGTTITEAARRAGYSEKNLAQSGHQVLQAIRLKMPELMDDIGLTERALIEKHLVPLLSATTTKYFQHHGRVNQKRQVADNDARLRALDVALRLRGSYAPKGSEAAEGVGVKVLVLDIPRPERSALLPKPCGLAVCPDSSIPLSGSARD